MKYSEIERIFTETVAGFISGGFTFCTGTMGGSQGDIARVDLIRGGEFVRIRLAKEYADFGKLGEDAVVLSVGRMDASKFSGGCLCDGNLHEASVFSGSLSFDPAEQRTFRADSYRFSSFTEEV